MFNPISLESERRRRKATVSRWVGARGVAAWRREKKLIVIYALG